MSVYSSLILAHASLRVYYRLGEGSGTTLADAGPNNLPLTAAASGITYGVAGAIANDADTALTFDGTSDPASRADDDALDVGDTFSIEFWVKRSSTQSAVQMLVFKAAAGGYQVWFTAANTIAFGPNNAAGVAASLTAAAITDTTTWHHVVVTKNGSARAVYLDGVDRTSLATNATVSDTTGVLRLGFQVPGSQRFPGSLDEVAIYGAVLTPAEVLQHYNVGKGIIENAAPITVAGEAPSQTLSVVSSAQDIAVVGLAPTVTVSQSVPVADVQVDGLAPTSTVSDEETVTVADIAVTGLAPEPKVSLEATTADVAVSGEDSTPGVGVEASAAQIAVEGLDATVAGDRTVSVDAGDIAVEGLAPTVSTVAPAIERSRGAFIPPPAVDVLIGVSTAYVWVEGQGPTVSVSLTPTTGTYEPDTELEDLELLALA